jgi:hypothetical protein
MPVWQTGKIEPVRISATEPMNQKWLLGAVCASIVLFGVLLMHSAPMSFATATSIGEHSMTSTVSAPPAVDEHSGASSATASESGSAAHCGNGCGDHSSVMHLCLAIIGAVAALAVLRAIVVGFAGSLVHAARLSAVRRRTGHPPPWTIFTLSELSVLRI